MNRDAPGDRHSLPIYLLNGSNWPTATASAKRELGNRASTETHTPAYCTSFRSNRVFRPGLADSASQQVRPGVNNSVKRPELGRCAATESPSIWTVTRKRLSRRTKRPAVNGGDFTQPIIRQAPGMTSTPHPTFPLPTPYVSPRQNRARNQPVVATHSLFALRDKKRFDKRDSLC